MSRLPQPGGDEGNWGAVLNDYLLAAHDASGVLRADSVQEAQLTPSVRTKLNTTDWSGITGKPTIPRIVASIAAPSSPVVGDMWVDLSA